MRNLIGTFGAGAAFDPATVHIMIGAFDGAWASLMNIIEAAKNGERNQRNLTEGALLHLTRTNLKKPTRDERQ